VIPFFFGGDNDDDVEAPRVAEEQAEIQAELVDDTEQEQMRQDYEERLQEEVQAMKQAPLAEAWSPTDKRKKVVFFTLCRCLHCRGCSWYYCAICSE
jgi:hypothetical protein